MQIIKRMKMITINTLKRIAPLINLSELCRTTGINTSVLQRKVKKSTDLTTTESQLIEQSLNNYGITIND